MLSSYQDLIVWQKAMHLVRGIYRTTRHLPTHEQYGLVAQMRRASISIPANIAEGYQRRSRKEYIRFLSVAEASAAELETFLLLIYDLYPHVTVAPLAEECVEIRKIFTVLQNRLRSTTRDQQP